MTLISPIDPSTKDGRDGYCPPTASNGRPGRDGSRGYNAGDGGNGTDGERGSRGEEGGDAAPGMHNQNVQVNLFRQSEDSVGVWRSDIGQNSVPIPLYSPGFVLIDTKGGKGGQGGRGGAGGTFAIVSIFF